MKTLKDLSMVGIKKEQKELFDKIVEATTKYRDLDDVSIDEVIALDLKEGELILYQEGEDGINWATIKEILKDNKNLNELKNSFVEYLKVI